MLKTILLFKYLLALLLIFLLIRPELSLALQRPPNAQGGFFVLDGLGGGTSGKPYYGGGAAMLDWRDFEPEEGQYRWELLTDPNVRYMPWLEIFNARIKGRTPSQQASPASYIINAPRKVRFKLRVTEGAVPLWLYGGEDINGRSPTSYGTICAYKTYDQVYAQDPDCNPETNIVIAITYPLYPTKEDNSEPVWWNPIFQEKFRRTLLAIGEKIESTPALKNKIEFVEASVGSYGEMILYGKGDTFQTDSPNQKLFKKAGYTNALYSDSVQRVIYFYMEAFPNLPIALSLGNGLYAGPVDDGSGVTSVLADVLPKVTASWGSHLYLKHAGFGAGRLGYVGNNFRQYCPHKTRCIYESFGTITAWPGWPWNADHTDLENIFEYAVIDKAYIIMMWTSDWRVILSDTAHPEYANLEQAFYDIAPRLWAIGAVTPSPAPPTPTMWPTMTPRPTITPGGPTSTPGGPTPTSYPSPTLGPTGEPVCDLCGWCEPVRKPKPPNWQECYDCLYDETGLPTGNYYTVLGCLSTKPGLFVRSILSIVFAMVGGIAFLAFLAGAFLLLTSKGDIDKLKLGKEIIISSLIGLLLVIFSVFILRAIGFDILRIPGLG